MKMLRRATPPPVPPPVQGDEIATRRRVEVTIERVWEREREVGGVPAATASFEAHCVDCGRRVPMLDPSAAALLAQVTVRTIYRWVDEKKLHFLESPSGDLYLCAQSVAAPHQTQHVSSGDPR